MPVVCSHTAATDGRPPDAVCLASVSLALLERQCTSAAPPGPNSWKQARGDAPCRVVPAAAAAAAALPEGRGGAETRLCRCACVRAAPNPSGGIPNEPDGEARRRWINLLPHAVNHLHLGWGRGCRDGGTGGALRPAKGQNPPRPLTLPPPSRDSCFSLEATGSSAGPGMKAPQRGMGSPLIKLHRWSPPRWPPPRWPSTSPMGNKAVGGCGPPVLPSFTRTTRHFTSADISNN